MGAGSGASLPFDRHWEDLISHKVLLLYEGQRGNVEKIQSTLKVTWLDAGVGVGRPQLYVWVCLSFLHELGPPPWTLFGLYSSLG